MFRQLLRKHEGLLWGIGAMAFGIACLYGLWLVVPSLLRWIFEVLGYPFWLVYTKLANIQIDQFDSFWLTIAIAIFVLMLSGILHSIRPVTVIQKTVKSGPKGE